MSPRGPADTRRRKLRKRILGGAAIGIVVVLVALWFSDTIRIPREGPRFAGGTELTTDEDGQPARVEGQIAPSRRALNLMQPLRLWVGGDSLAGALGPALGAMTAETGVVQPYYDSRISTGLMSGDFNWSKHAKQELERIQPEAVVFIIGTNDAIVYDDAQEEKYRLLTDQMMQTLIGEMMADEDLEENIVEIDRIQREVAQKYADNVTFVDAHTLFADEQGEYQSSIEDENGDSRYLRAGDGIHLSGDGAEYLAEHVYELLDAEWKITQQAVPGHPTKVIVTKGSTQIPGSGSSRSSGSSNWRGSSSSSSSGSSNDETTDTTAATTATTAPPATTPSTSPPVTSPPPSSTPPATTPSG
jgi:lysophospholipase L1-like esterase